MLLLCILQSWSQLIHVERPQKWMPKRTDLFYFYFELYINRVGKNSEIISNKMEQTIYWYIKQCGWIAKTSSLVKMLTFYGAVVKNMFANAGDAQDTIRSLCGEDCLEEEIATHSSILAWRIPWTEEPGRLEFMGLQSQKQANTRMPKVT